MVCNLYVPIPRFSCVHGRREGTDLCWQDSSDLGGMPTFVSFRFGVMFLAPGFYDRFLVKYVDDLIIGFG